MKKWMLAGLTLLGFAAGANEKLVFSCDFSSGFKPQTSVQPCDVLVKDVQVVDSDRGKALRFGKTPDGKVSCLTFRLKDTVSAAKTAEDALPFPLRFGRMEFQFRAVDWKPGDPPFNMFVKMEGPRRSNLHVLYTRPSSTGIASVQAAYGQYQNPAVEKGRIPVIFPTAALNLQQEWHSVVFEWKPDKVCLTVDGKTVLCSTRNLAYPEKDFYATQLQIGSPYESLLRGMSEIRDLKIYSTLPEKTAAVSRKINPELTVNRINAPEIDGRISAGEWADASRYTGFSKLPGSRISHHQPEVRFGYDDRALYVALISKGPQRAPVAEKTRRDSNVWEDDGVELYLQPDSQPENLYQLIINPQGTVYDQRIRKSSSAAENAAWNCNGLHAVTKISDGIWCTELAIPFSDLGLTAPNPGDTWRFNLCETLQGIGFFSMAPVQNSYAESERFGVLRFAAENAPVVDFAELGSLFSGSAEFRCQVRGGNSAEMEINGVRYDETAQTDFPLFGEVVKIPPQGLCLPITEEKLGKNGTLYVRISRNGRTLYSGRFNYEAVREAEIETMRRIVRDGSDFLKVTTSHPPAPCTRLHLTLTDADGKTVLSRQSELKGMRQDTLLPLAGLKTGDWLVHLELRDRNGSLLQKGTPRAFRIYDKITPWQNSALGKTDRVPAPWTPLKISRNAERITVECWNRTYVFGPDSLFAEQIRTAGQNCLTAPVRLNVKADGKPCRIVSSQANMLSQSDRRAVVEMCAMTEAGQIRVIAEIDYDGFIWYRLIPGAIQAETLENLSVELSMPAAVSGLLNSGDRALQNTGNTPRQWSKKLDDTFGPFWIGNEKGGLSFGIESAAGWSNRDPGQQATVHRQPDHTAIRLNVIDRPVRFNPDQEFSFYIHPTPVRPRPAVFRKLRTDSWFGHNRAELEGKGYPSNLSWWMSSFTFQGYPEWVTDRKSIMKMDKRLANFGYRVRPYNHYENLTRAKSRSAWYAAYSSIGRNAPEVIWNGELWRAGTQDRLYGNTLYDYTMDMIEVCKTDDYINFYLWRFDRSRQGHPEIDGLYFDLMFWPACTRADHGHGYTDAQGRRHATYAVREHRKWLERLYVYCQENADGAPIVTHLSGSTSRVAGFSWASYFLDGELWQNELVRDRSYRDLKLDQLRTEALPHIWGAGVIWCSQLYRIYPFVPAGERKTWKKEPWAERHIAGMLLLHDVIPDRTSQNDTAWKIWLALDRFGLAEDDSYLPYWEKSGVKSNADGVSTAVSGWLKPAEKKLLLTVFNNHDRTQTFRIHPDLPELRGGKSLTARDLESGQIVPDNGDGFILTVPQRNFRLIEIKVQN